MPQLAGPVSWLGHSGELAAAEAPLLLDVVCNQKWQPPPHKLVLLGHTTPTLAAICPGALQAGRICAWPGFLERPAWEVAVAAPVEAYWLLQMEVAIGKKLIPVADVPGLVAPRTLAQIINEACYLLAEGAATSQDIDLAMQLGTNYPLGPLEWVRKIGTAPIYQLLETLAVQEPHFAPHALLKNPLPWPTS